MEPSMTHHDKTSRFCALPPEIKNKIYRLLLVKENDINTPPVESDLFCNCDDEVCVCPNPLDDGRPGLQPAVLLANRQICEEATSILYGENCFDVNVGMGWITDFRGATFNNPQRNGFCNHPQFSKVRSLNARVCVTMIDSHDEKEDMERIRGSVSDLCKMLADREPLDVLKISFMYDRPSRAGQEVYERVLEPFSMLRNIAHVEITPQVNGFLAMILKAVMESDTAIVPLGGEEGSEGDWEDCDEEDEDFGHSLTDDALAEVESMLNWLC
ncbi:MAG: hypothetical protein M1830_009131 [Pleopsidium flavum]|nr:MAG: hypothetical protein M1830_009131 [Pleopsidium flavum]